MSVQFTCGPGLRVRHENDCTLLRSCVRISRVLFVLHMYEELQPGQMNSYVTVDWLNCGVLTLVLVKKHNFGLFCSDVYIWVDETSPKLTSKLLNKLRC